MMTSTEEEYELSSNYQTETSEDKGEGDLSNTDLSNTLVSDEVREQQAVDIIAGALEETGGRRERKVI